MSTARLTRLLLQIAVLATVIVVLPYKLFELDRYFVPKELVLHAAALLTFALLLFSRGRTVRFDAADALLIVFLAWSTLSALAATNHWLAQRALGLSFSSAILFWGARRLGALRKHRPILAAGAFAAAVAAATSLVQAYGVESVYFSLNRAPGGTFGNRNFIAHFAAIGLPALLYCTITARRGFTASVWAVGIALVTAALVLSRSRAGWLAVLVSAFVFAVLLLAARRHWSDPARRARIALLALAAFLGGSAAIVLPNELDWASDSPYLDSARGMVDYRTGSGAGRLAQYRNSLQLARDNPVLGAGPGNWPVEYVRFAPRGDRSLMDDGMTANPWPSSDWVAFVSERGAVAAIALLGVIAAVFIGMLRRWRETDGDGVLARIAGAATVAATMTVSAFDAVLLLAAPALLVWTILGATSGIARVGREVSPPRGFMLLAATAATIVLVAAVVRSAAQVVALTKVGTGGTRAGWLAAAPWDPGSYRINQRVAELQANRGNCRSARSYARRAQELFPEAAAPRRVLVRCGVAR